MFRGAGSVRSALKNRLPGGLPGRANATIRSPAASGSIRQGPGSARRHRSLKALICRVYLFVTKAKRRCPDRVGRGEADVFAPFVYRLGRHPFTVERAVRFR
jgi:hypothetical protein